MTEPGILTLKSSQEIEEECTWGGGGGGGGAQSE